MTEPKNPYQGIKWKKTTSTIKDKDGKTIFEKEVEFPDYFREQDIKIVASKYLCNAAKKEETSLKQMVDRVSDTITEWGYKDGYFNDEQEVEEFRYKLKYYQVHQFFAFNSPVYFNVGLVEDPQASACFILNVDDNMESITNWLSHEATIFKNGSGSGLNLSKIRGTNEVVRGGGTASGPVSFLKGTDVFAGVIKSGGTLRRSAKLACLDMDHPDILSFMNCKDKEDRKMQILKDAGITPESGYEMSDEVFFQNTNLSVRISDDFIGSVKMNGEWHTINRVDGEIHETFKAKGLLEEIAEHAWRTGDPGVQFHDNINRMNPVIGDGEINGSNPCSEFMFLDNTSCNLASHNLKKCLNPDGTFNFELYNDMVQVMITAQDILVDRASYPVDEIEKNTKKYRPLGMGYANLGAMLMSLGMPYDSDTARELSGLITAYHQGAAYLQSKKIAAVKGAPKWWTVKNKKTMYKVLNNHYESLLDIPDVLGQFTYLKNAAIDIWKQVLADDGPVMNAQVSVLAPTGTISFLMGCDTQGVEPDFSLIKFKTLSGNDGATIMTVNNTVRESLSNLGYSSETVSNIIQQMIDGTPIEKIVEVNQTHTAIFDTANPPLGGTRSIHYMGHLKMMAAVQPFLSGAISKTVNLPEDATVQDIYNIYLRSWEMKLKSVAIYRDNSKAAQVLSTSNEIGTMVSGSGKSTRRKLPDDRSGDTHKFTINGSNKGYVISNPYDDGDLAEVFVSIAKSGSTLSGLLNCLFTVTSISLQHGVPLFNIARKMIGTKFDPAGFTQNPKIRTTSSLVDYIFRHLGMKYLSVPEQEQLGLLKISNVETEATLQDTNNTGQVQLSVGLCPECGSLMRRLGSCEFCDNCSYTGGSCG